MQELTNEGAEVQTRNGLYGFEFRKPDLRRKPAGERKTYDIQQLWQRNHEIVNLAASWQRNHEIVNLAARGFKGTEIAEILNINQQTVSNTLNSELGQCKLSDIRLERDEETKKVSEKIRTLTNKALDTYHKIFDDESGELGLKDKGNFATSFLGEMSGLRAPTKIQSQSISTVLTAEELEEFKVRGIAAARASGLIVECPVQPHGMNSDNNNDDNEKEMEDGNH
jgi:predicted transcriptional regulator